MKFKKQHKIGISLAILIIAGAFLFKENQRFSLIIGIGIIVGILPFVFSTIIETKIAREKEEMFLEFARNLVESVKMGSSISKSILILKNRNYEVLNKHVGKLANQLSMGISLNIAMQTFSKDIDNKKISKAEFLKKTGGMNTYIGQLYQTKNPLQGAFVYFSSTDAPAASNFFFNSSASSFFAPSFTV